MHIFQKSSSRTFLFVALSGCILFFLYRVFVYSHTNVLRGLDDAYVPVQGQADSPHLLISFWGTWCSACAKDHPLLLELSKSGLPIVGINMMDSVDQSSSWLRTRGDPYFKKYNDEDGTIAKLNNVYGAPVFFVVDRDGSILFRHEGVMTNEVAKKMLSEYL